MWARTADCAWRQEVTQALPALIVRFEHHHDTWSDALAKRACGHGQTTIIAPPGLDVSDAHR